MENTNPNPPRQPNPRRRKRDPKRIFMESYLPVIILGGIILLIILLIVSCANNGKRSDEQARKASLAALEEENKKTAAHKEEAQECLAQAQAAADSYEFETAIDILDGFSGNIYDFDELLALRDHCKDSMDNTVQYSPEQVVNLSVQMLIAEPDRAFSSAKYAESYKKNFLTTDEFRNLLSQLYNNGYVLVDMDDLVSTTEGEGGTAYAAKTITLPHSKKPLMLTQCQVNYYSYMIDPDTDGNPDANGAGFASRMILQNGQLLNEMVSADGQTVIGSYDLVPVLEEFIAEHPDFSYKGARATLSFTGYEGVLGYRHDKLAEAVPVLEELRARGYRLGFYTYANSDYSASTAAQIDAEVQRWNKYIVPTLGQTDIMVYARSTDIAGPGPYSGDKFNTLQGHGFRYYLGYCSDGKPWFVCESTYVRQGRISVSAQSLTEHPEWFGGIADPNAVLIEAR